MFLLTVGMLVWAAMHLIQFWGAGIRNGMIARVGEGPWKGIFALIVFGALALIIIGYRGAGYSEFWLPPAWMNHVTLLLMLPAMVLFIAAQAPANVVRARVRHPMLAGASVWAFAHLLANGDLASVILFGGFLVWTALERSLLIRRDADKALPEAKPGFAGWVPVLAGVAVYVIVLLGHEWAIGVSPLAI